MKRGLKVSSSRVSSLSFKSSLDEKRIERAVNLRSFVFQFSFSMKRGLKVVKSFITQSSKNHSMKRGLKALSIFNSLFFSQLSMKRGLKVSF